MSLSTGDTVREVFRSAVREDLQKHLKTGEDRDQVNAILRETDARLMKEQASYTRDYTRRIAEAKEIILREENGVRLDQPLPPGAERHSTADELQRKADVRVRRDHDQRCAVIKSDELARFKSLSEDIHARDSPDLEHSFTQARTHTRSGPSRT